MIRQKMQRAFATLLIAGLILLSGMRARAQVTTTYPYNQNGVVEGGGWLNYTQGGTGGPRLSRVSYNGGTFDFVATGTACSLASYQWGASNITVTVRALDGTVQVATFTPSPTLNVWASGLVLFSGLAEGPHWVSISMPTGGLYFDETTNALSVTGASPSISYPTNFGPKGYLADPAITPHVLITGLTQQTFSSYTQLQTYSSDGEIWFYASATAISIHEFADSSKFRLLNVDTGVSYVVTDAGDNGNRWLLLASGLDNTRHLWKITGSTLSAGVLLRNLMVAGGGLDLTATIPSRPVLAVYGDSITAAIVGTNTQSWLGYGHLIADLKNWILYNLGIGGTPVSSTAGSNAGETDARCNSVIATAASTVFVHYGTNDMHSGVAAATTFRAAYTSMLTKLTTGLPNARFVVLGILPTNFDSFDTQAYVDNYNAQIVAAIAATKVTNPTANITYVDPHPWLMGGATYAGGGAAGTLVVSPNYIDGLHPTPAGYQFMLTNLTSLFSTQQFLSKTKHSRAGRNEGRATGARN